MTSAARILFVDDEVRVLDGLRRALRPNTSFWSMDFISNPREALTRFRLKPFDVVVTDLAMPDLNGIELVVKMREIEPKTAFIMLTGTADLPQAVEAINKAQVFRFFTKPCATLLLVEGINAALAAQHQNHASKSVKANAIYPIPDFTAGIGMAALNRVSFAVFVLNQHCRVLLSNRTGGELLSQRDGLMMGPNGVLRANTVAETDQLHRLIKSVLAHEANDDDSSGLSILRSSSQKPINLVIGSAPTIEPTQDGPLVVVFASDPEQLPLPKADSIGKLFNLTPSESRLTHALIQGLKMDEAALKCGITTSTARTYLKQIFMKTGTNRQPELVKLILTSPTLAV